MKQSEIDFLAELFGGGPEELLADSIAGILLHQDPQDETDRIIREALNEDNMRYGPLMERLVTRDQFIAAYTLGTEMAKEDDGTVKL